MMMIMIVIIIIIIITIMITIDYIFVRFGFNCHIGTLWEYIPLGCPFSQNLWLCL